MNQAWHGRDVGPGDAALGGLVALLSIAGLLGALGFGGTDGLDRSPTAVPPPIAVTVGIATEASLGLPPGGPRPPKKTRRPAEPDPASPPPVSHKPASVEPSRARPVAPSSPVPPAPTAEPSATGDVEPAPSPDGTQESGEAVADDSAVGDPAAADSDVEDSGGGDSDRQQQAWAILRTRLVRWFATRFRVSGSGLEPDALMKLQAHATVSISPDGIVERYVLSGSGNDVFDAAATRALEGTVGEHLPSSPGAASLSLPPTFSITFVCKPTTCD